VVVWVAGLLARASLPLLIRDHPLLLIVLDARTRNLLLVSAKVGAAEFIGVAMVWRFAVFLLYYMLGRWYGDSALRWLGRRSRLNGWIIDRFEFIFSRFANPAVFLLSGKLVSALAGVAGMSPLRFVVLQLSGTVVQVVALRLFAQSQDPALGRVVELIDRNAVLLTIAFTVATFGSLVLASVIRHRQFRELKETRPQERVAATRKEDDRNSELQVKMQDDEP
jgi:membrane protein DedA with SNARE-associated domain